jgi:hypothetical protein
MGQLSGMQGVVIETYGLDSMVAISVAFREKSFVFIVATVVVRGGGLQESAIQFAYCTSLRQRSFVVVA